jgi:hypothetical protein
MNQLAEDIFDRFRDGAVVRGGEYWFSSAAAVDVLREARTWSLELLGFDAARLSEAATWPDLENSWDYSSASSRISDPYRHAIDFFESKSKSDLRFCIVLSDTSNIGRPSQ